MEINLRMSVYLPDLWSIKHLSQLCHACMKHKWRDIYILQLTPFETVCKQFINGSVPFDYSLNSGFDKYDSWFSDDVWQMVTSA